ncbi:MAG TPA: BBP7 family outer membrane beta-barrel protein [Pirellulaceae bacterium]|nr:BBP7 family outer membrane beta-barrel protein [Pirellulaceae bacterium]
MQFRNQVPTILGLLLGCCPALASAQINTGYFPDGAPLPVVEPFYDPGPFTSGCYRDIGPCWLGQATFDLLLFNRSAAESRTIVTETGTGDPLLNTADLGFPVAAGFRFNLVFPGHDGCDLVFNYLGIQFENSRVHSATTANYDFFEFPALSPATSTDFQTSYTSTLRSVELGGRIRRWSRFAPLAGFRFIQLEDQFDRMSGDASMDLALSETDNQLWGFQIGGEALLWDAGPVRLQSTVKGGVFYNSLNLSTAGETITAGATMIDPTAAFSSGHVAFFGEVNLELAYQIGPQFSIRAGYTAMWLDGVALAPDQYDNFNLQSGIGTFDYGTVMYHGTYVGLELTW